MPVDRSGLVARSRRAGCVATVSAEPFRRRRPVKQQHRTGCVEAVSAVPAGPGNR